MTVANACLNCGCAHSECECQNANNAPLPIFEDPNGTAQQKAAWKTTTIYEQVARLEWLKHDLEKLKKKQNEPNDGTSYYLRGLSIYLDDRISEKEWTIKEQGKYIKRLEKEL